MAEIRCLCGRLAGVASEDADGGVSWPCARCKGTVRLGDVVGSTRINCECGKWIARGSLLSGEVIVSCRNCKVLTAIRPDGVAHPIEPPRQVRKVKKKPPTKAVVQYRGRLGTLTDDELVAVLENRWRVLRLDRVQRSVTLAVGLRFDVFHRDGFRCVYCGRRPRDGVTLEADHRLARANGGLDTLDNLVTACWDCNRGKSAKALDERGLSA